MITAILAGIFFVVDPFLGVIVALVTPSIVALDYTNEFYEVGALVIIYGAMYFMRQMRIEEK